MEWEIVMAAVVATVLLIVGGVFLGMLIADVRAERRRNQEERQRLAEPVS
jgi:uncharacterized membrane-anchored protein YhcB (DUF1043 family)